MQKRFEGIEDPVKRAEVLRFMYSGEVSEFAKNAPVVIAVIGSLMEGSVDVPYDLSACIENILLEAHSLGLGACWVHGPVASSRDARRFKRILKIPEAWANTSHRLCRHRLACGSAQTPAAQETS